MVPLAIVSFVLDAISYKIFTFHPFFIQIFDKRYYEEFIRRAWIPRNPGTNIQDWTWGGNNGDSPRFFLNTDMCLLFDIETSFPCCTRTDLTNNNGGNQCDRNGLVLSNTPCASYAPGSVLEEAADAVRLFAGERAGGGFNNDNGPFYTAFASAWSKATTNGLSGLAPFPGTSFSPTLQQLSASPTPPQPSVSPTRPQPSASPTPKPTRAPGVAFVTEQEYDAIDADIAALSTAFGNDDIARAHFLGGIVRLVAHDFMDFSINEAIPMGSDGCIDMEHPDNSGLPQDIWCDNGCPLTEVYNSNFAHISKADFWIAAANAVIRLASNNGLDLKSTYVSGRVDANSCDGQGLRLPAASGCDAVQGVFVDRMGLTLTDGVALLGAHTIGRGNELFSGHHGIWVDTEAQSVVSKWYLWR